MERPILMNKNLCFTLAFNLVSEVTDAVRRLYEQNKKEDFTHTIVDCEFPLLSGDRIPDNIEEAKDKNSQSLQQLADYYGSDYVKIKNEGVSQNWSAMYDHYKPDDSDVMTCVEPDEIPIESGWIKALGDVLRADVTMGYAAPTLIDHKELLKRTKYARLVQISGHNIYIMSGNVNYGLLAISGRLLNKMGSLAPHHATPIYGNIESVLLAALKKYSMRWGILKDYCQIHTNVPKLYRAWKDAQIFGADKNKQIPFEQWLERERLCQK